MLVAIEHKRWSAADENGVKTPLDVPIVRLISDDGQVLEVPEADFTAAPETYVSQLTSLPEARKAKLAALANARWEKTQVMTFDGIKTPCGDGARAALLGAVFGLQLAGSQGPVTWKLAEGEFRSWLLPELVTFGQAMRLHVQACFDNEALLTQAVEAAPTSADVARIDLTQGWPVTAVVDVVTP